MAFGVTAHEGNTMHWFSDVAAGTLIGFAIGQTVGRNFGSNIKERTERRENNSISIIPYTNPDSAGIIFSYSYCRGLLDGNKTLWGGFIIEGARGRIYFAGDTGYGCFVQKLHDIFPEFRLTIFPIGSYEKRWIMKTQHINPDDAVRAHKLLNSRQSIGMHYATFKEHPEQTVDQHETDLAKAINEHNIQPSEFLILKFGEGIYIP